MRYSLQTVFYFHKKIRTNSIIIIDIIDYIKLLKNNI